MTKYFPPNIGCNRPCFQSSCHYKCVFVDQLSSKLIDMKVNSYEARVYTIKLKVNKTIHIREYNNIHRFV